MICLVLLLLTGPTVYGANCYKKPHDVADCKRKAAQGLSRAQNILGFVYTKGRGVPQDFQKAAHWYRKSALQGFVLGQVNLGWLYMTGKGVEQNYTDAAKWYEKAALQGDSNAALQLGLLYQDGYGVPLDRTLATMWFSIASEQGSITAPKHQAIIAHKMSSNAIEDARALTRQWLRNFIITAFSSATQNHCNAQNCTQDADLWFVIGKQYSDAQSSWKQNYKRALQSFQRAARKGNIKALVSIGSIYDQGLGVAQNHQEAALWYRYAAEHGSANGQFNLGHMYARGEGVIKNYNDAAQWYKQAAEQGETSAQYQLSKLYNAGQGVEKNPLLAQQWLSRAENSQNAIENSRGDFSRVQISKQGRWNLYTQTCSRGFTACQLTAEAGDAWAQNKLGLFYKEGKDVTQNYKKAVKWFKKSADQGSGRGFYNLSTMYLNGYGVPKDIDQSEKLLAAAKKNWDRYKLAQSKNAQIPVMAPVSIDNQPRLK